MDTRDLPIIERVGALAKRVDDHIRRSHAASSDTPRAGFVPRGGADATIAPGWLPDTSGPAFPAVPRLYQRHWHTTRLLDYVWDGARWVTAQEKDHTWGFPRVLQPQSVTGISAQSPIDQRYRHRWHYLSVRTFISGAVQDVVNNWTVEIVKTGANGATLLYTFATTNDTANNGIERVPGIAMESAAGDQIVYVNAIANGTPGTISVVADLKYRLLG